MILYGNQFLARSHRTTVKLRLPASPYLGAHIRSITNRKLLENAQLQNLILLSRTGLCKCIPIFIKVGRKQ